MPQISLATKYQPSSIAGFVGMERPRALLGSLVKEPYASAWLFVGPSGIGKTTMALALAKQIRAELHHIASKECNLATVDDVTSRCWYTPMYGEFHLVLCDEADQMSRAAQLAFLSKMDATAAPPKTIFIFTANSTKLFEDRFLSRCRLVRFSTAQLLEPATQLLKKIWRRETKEPAPDFGDILKRNGCNIRAALMTLETEMIMPAMEEEMEDDKSVVRFDRTTEVDPMRSEASKRAWVTIRARRAAKAQA